MTPLLLMLAAVAAPDCPMDQVLRALSGEGDSPHEHVLQPPPQLDATPSSGGGTKDKLLYGNPMDHRVDSDNFSVQWMSGDGDMATGQLASDAMEDAWTALVEELDWRQPVSSELYLLWVILDPSLGGGTGLTTVYPSDDYAQGYPVIYLNPDYSWDEAFFRTLCAHEFVHALQYAVRTWTDVDEEAWYWEASAEWGAELAVPELDVYAGSSAYYADHPWYRYSSTEDWHEYGMFVLNAYIEEFVTGEGGMRAVWLESEDRPGDNWLKILEAATDTEAEDLWGGMVSALCAEDLRESGLYDPVMVDGPVEDGLEGEVALLGTDYFEASEDLLVTVEAVVADERVMVSSPEGWGASVVAYAGDLVGVTGLTIPTVGYRLSTESYVPPPEDEDSADDDDDDDADGCSCSAGGVARPMALVWALVFGVGWLHLGRRRRTSLPG